MSPTFLRQVTQRFFFFLASLSPSLSSSWLLGPAQSALSSGSDFWKKEKWFGENVPGWLIEFIVEDSMCDCEMNSPQSIKLPSFNWPLTIWCDDLNMIVAWTASSTTNSRLEIFLWPSFLWSPLPTLYQQTVIVCVLRNFRDFHGSCRRWSGVGSKMFKCEFHHIELFVKF